MTLNVISFFHNLCESNIVAMYMEMKYHWRMVTYAIQVITSPKRDEIVI